LRISTDTRTLGPGDLFVALKGDRFDGHDHLAAARAAGAAAAVVRAGTPPVEGLRLLPVPDTLRALGDLARARRRAAMGPIVAVTGTNGKTSTKEMIAAALRTRFPTHATRANLNNLVGVPQTILEAPAGTEALVVEAGANTPGEIPRYREIIEPCIAVVTNVGAGHLEGFGSLEGVMREKLALVEGVEVAVVGTDPPSLGLEARARAVRAVTAGLEGADVTPDRLTLDSLGRPVVGIDGVEIRLPYPGRHLAANAMLAWGVVRELDLDRAASAAALSALVLPGGRTEVRQVGGLTLLNDCYNANPQSFRAAIETVRAMRGGRRLVVVAGTMRELGRESPRLHTEVAADLLALEPDLLALVGEFVPAVNASAKALGDRLLTAATPEELGPRLAARLRGDELVLLKASRGVALERILPAITGRPTSSSH
jgi:UDP-N-acetylmuramoyl-tripeptide--D-alanyl-D-alanine ligase